MKWHRLFANFTLIFFYSTHKLICGDPETGILRLVACWWFLFLKNKQVIPLAAVRMCELVPRDFKTAGLWCHLEAICYNCTFVKLMKENSLRLLTAKIYNSLENKLSNSWPSGAGDSVLLNGSRAEKIKSKYVIKYVLPKHFWWTTDEKLVPFFKILCILSII